MNRSTVEIGDKFEDAVATAFSLVSGLRVERRQRVGGKAVDVVVFQQGMLGASERKIAVECKDWSRRLTRKQVADIMSDYWPLLANRLVEEVILVTRNGVQENALGVLQAPQSRHLLYSEIVRAVLDLSKLAHEMRGQFSNDILSEVYEPPTGKGVDLRLALRNFGAYTSPFLRSEAADKDGDATKIGYVSEEKWNAVAEAVVQQKLEARKREWNELASSSDSRRGLSLRRSFKDVRDLNSFDYQAILNDLVRRQDEDLLHMIRTWVDNDSDVDLALLGTYGTGKSSFARHLAYIFADEYMQSTNTRVPLLVELRRFSADQDIESLITNELVNRNGVEGATFTRFQALNRAGYFLVILDGFDEMKHGMSREAMYHNFNQINRLSVGRAKVLIIGRPTIFENSSEQDEFLRGQLEGSFQAQARYLPLQISPMPRRKIRRMLNRYAQSSAVRGSKESVHNFDILMKELSRNEDTRNLLERPVHIPMLLEILPSLDAEGVKNLQRSYLYSEFIKRTIAREAERNRSSTSRSIEQRTDFASALALEMMQQEEARSISVSAIPRYVIEPFVLSGESLETTRRELVTACFLEFKPPDVLFFGHKSYCEFLTSCELLRKVRANEDIRANRNVMTPEVMEFLVGNCNEQDLRNLVTNYTYYHLELALMINSAVHSKYDRKKRVSLFDMILQEDTAEDVRRTVNEPGGQELVSAFAKIYFFRPRKGRYVDAESLLNDLCEHPRSGIAAAAARAFQEPEEEYIARTSAFVSNDSYSWGAT